MNKSKFIVPSVNLNFPHTFPIIIINELTALEKQPVHKNL